MRQLNFVEIASVLQNLKYWVLQYFKVSTRKLGKHFRPWKKQVRSVIRAIVQESFHRRIYSLTYMKLKLSESHQPVPKIWAKSRALLENSNFVQGVNSRHYFRKYTGKGHELHYLLPSSMHISFFRRAVFSVAFHRFFWTKKNLDKVAQHTHK